MPKRGKTKIYGAQTAVCRRGIARCGGTSLEHCRQIQKKTGAPKSARLGVSIKVSEILRRRRTPWRGYAPHLYSDREWADWPVVEGRSSECWPYLRLGSGGVAGTFLH